VDGPCEKRDTLLGKPNGCVVELALSRQWTGNVIAHEVGHYLGLEHEHDRTNLMCGSFAVEEATRGSSQPQSPQNRPRR
jgi:Matrixin